MLRWTLHTWTPSASKIEVSKCTHKISKCEVDMNELRSPVHASFITPDLASACAWCLLLNKGRCVCAYVCTI